MDLSLIEQSIQMIEEAKKKHKEELNKAIKPGLEYIAKTYGEQIQSIHIIGFTPGFNDGEPCEHSSDWGVGFGWLQNYGLEYLLEGWFEEELENNEELMDHILSINVEVPEEVKQFISKVLDPFYEDKLGTDYQVHIRFSNGTYELEEDEYYCGY